DPALDERRSRGCGWASLLGVRGTGDWGSGDEEDLAGRLAALEGGVGGGRLLERELLADPDVQPVGHRGEEVVGPPQQLRAVRGVVPERRPGDEQRAGAVEPLE